MLGLTATPIRRDGQQPIIFMQCGPIRHTADKSESAPHDLEVSPRSLHKQIDLPQEAGIQEVFRHLANDPDRTAGIAAEIENAYKQGRKVLVLTERIEHLDAILAALDGKVPAPFTMHGRMSKKRRATLIAELEALPPAAPRILLATGKLVGEGFDHPPLDTLVLALPISWKGTLQQYAGRLHRRTRHQDRRADHRLRGHGPPGVAANVGQAAAGLSGNGLSDGSAIRAERTNTGIISLVTR